MAGLIRVAGQAPDELAPFNRDRLFVALLDSCRHRATALDDAAALTTTIVRAALTGQEQRGIISKQQLAALSYDLLRRFDPAAASHYRAYHPAYFTP